MPIRRRELLKATAAAVLVTKPALAQIPAPLTSPAEISFLTIGDWGNPKNRSDAKSVAKAMALVAEEQRTGFVVAAGDNFYPAGVSGVGDPLWQVAFEQIYSDNALDVPWHVALGNHDHKGNIQAQIDYSEHSGRWDLPEPYYVLHKSRQGITADFFFIDTTPMAKVNFWTELIWSVSEVEDQLRWLERELAASSAHWKIVVGHHPVFSGGTHGDTPFLVERLPPIFKSHGVQLYLNGHDHDLQHIRRGETSYLTSGSAANFRTTSAVEGTRFAQARLGFLSTRLRLKSATLTFVADDMQTLYETTIGNGAS
ncbi:MAG: metallophosphoesterase [Alphaproteobacteria bacterium]|nr:metallophosphoesterase [Alphaproteobacteria bacterium]MBU1549391.1 metallophosphoesterase [Alphaproteobacteria bacterium]MBU2387543.1 metallophosphoesterase [Alphaproteobacteria bacterium]|tara:strand:+ start:9490 stop:10425 length:936 start_codon:yes stop_codon:yes gene_type:complete